jgi:hypothetical protein
MPVQERGPSAVRRPASVASPRATTGGASIGTPRRRAASGPASSRPAARLRVEESSPPASFDLPVAARIEADIAQLNLSFLHVARELARSARELAVTRLGLDAAACAALDRLSIADLQALSHSHALIFGLRLDPADLPMQAELARTNRIASGARLLLAADAG